MAYQIWIYTVAGVKAAILENAKDISRERRMNETPSLKFTLPADDTKAVFLTSAYTVKVWNTTKEQLEGLFDIDDATERWDSSGSVIDVTCSGVLARLEKTDNITYDTTATPKTPTQIITALLALQEFTPALTVGTIEPTTSFAMAVENTNLLTAILKCPEYLGGYIDVDDTGALNWWNDPTGNPEREIRYKKNLKGLTRKQDFTAIRNKIYAYGAGETEAQITLIDAGEAYEYIEDTVSQNGDGTAAHPAYGIRIKRITDKRITHPATLLRWAQRYLAAYKDPVYTYSVDAVNLAAHPSFDFDLEELEIGQIVRVKNIDINLDVDVKIVALTTNLSNPEDIQVELANATPDLADLLGSAQAYQSLAQNVAVQIGAGQVIIQGTVTVDDWRTGGSTTIDGGKITADTIDCNSLKTSSITAKTITLGSATDTTAILKSYNYSAGASGWQIKADGTAEFGNVTVRGTIETCTLGSGKTMTVKGTLKSDNYVHDSAGWQLGGDGICDFYDIVVADNVHADTVTADGLIQTSFAYRLPSNTLNSAAPTRSIYTTDGTTLRWKDAAGGYHDLY